MMRLAVLIALVLAAGAAACNGGTTQYEVAVQFNTSYTQDDLDEAEAVLRGYDDDLEFLIMESFPPTGRALLETDEPDFCPTVEAELEAKTYVDGVSCQEIGEPPQSGDPDEPVQSP